MKKLILLFFAALQFIAIADPPIPGCLPCPPDPDERAPISLDFAR